MTSRERIHLISFAAEWTKLISFASARGTIPPSGDLGYAFHQLLAETFGAAAPKPFHFPDAVGGQAVAYSSHDAGTLKEIALRQRETVPDWNLASEALGLPSLTSCALPDWTGGARYRFSVRTRPVCRISRHWERGMPRECDVFLRAVASKPDSSEWLGRQEVYTAWFRENVPAAAASLVSVQVSRLSRCQVYRKGAPRVEGPDVSFSGVLEIGDPDAFQDFVKRGAGRHRAFGFGMILLASCGPGLGISSIGT
jgi:CRISPR system Cascade subunit CasE